MNADVTISIDDLHPEEGWGCEGDESVGYLEELNKEFGCKFNLFIPSNYHNKFALSKHKDWIDFWKEKDWVELSAHGHFHQCERTDVGECEFFDMNEDECIERINNMMHEWSEVGYLPEGWRNPGWICKQHCVEHLSNVFNWAALHKEHNFNMKWDLKMKMLNLFIPKKKKFYLQELV